VQQSVLSSRWFSVIFNRVGRRGYALVMRSKEVWFWPSSEEVNDFPDPVGIDAEWHDWPADIANGPSKYAEIFSREYIQNSWDSIQASRENSKKGDKPTKEGIRFAFVELSGDELKKFTEAFGIAEFSRRFLNFNKKLVKDSRLSQSDVVSQKNLKSLKVLVCSESGGGGMWGHWRTGGNAKIAGSRLRYALIQTASEKATAGSGGSWGHGKKAIAVASKCRTIAVYTCSPEQDAANDKPGVTRRFLGVAYWRRHTDQDQEHVGLGVCGKLVQNGTPVWSHFEPLENNEADNMVKALGLVGFETRSPSNPDDRGTSYLIVEPSFEPADLVSAIERNWWPLIEQHKIQLEVVGYDGNGLDIIPDQRTELLPFIQAFRIANGSGGPNSARTEVNADGKSIGNMAVVVDVEENGWSYRTDIEENTSVVALVRNDMVISYERSPSIRIGKPPFARGTLNVDREQNADASELLKLAEPHLHNEWRTRADMSTPEDAASISLKTLKKVHEEVLRVRKAHLKPEKPSDLHFDVFSEVFAGQETAVTKKIKRIDVQPRNYRIHDLSHTLQDPNIVDPTKIRLRTEMNLSLSENVDSSIDEIDSVVNLGWRVLEEGDSGGVIDPTLMDLESVVAPPGSILIEPGVYRVKVGGKPVHFAWESVFFPDDWQILPAPQVKEFNDEL